jgi:hypothetical protein
MTDLRPDLRGHFGRLVPDRNHGRLIPSTTSRTPVKVRHLSAMRARRKRLRFLSRDRVHEEHGARAAVGAFAVEGASVLADALAVPGFPAADQFSSSPATAKNSAGGRALLALLGNGRHRKTISGTLHSHSGKFEVTCRTWQRVRYHRQSRWLDARWPLKGA